MKKVLNFSEEKIIDILNSCGFTPKNSKELNIRANKYLKFLSLFETGRHKYKERVELDDRRVKSYGDWSQVRGDSLNFLFFRKNATKLNYKSDYSLLMIRDENGIPSKCLIYTLLGSYVGEIKIPILSGNISILSERWVDFVTWKNKLILTDSTTLASILSKSSVDSVGEFYYPICVLLSSDSEANFFSTTPPSIDVVLGANEKSHKFACLYNKNSAVNVYRLSSDESNMYSLSRGIEEEMLRIKPNSITKDIIYDVKNSKNNDINYFCQNALKAQNGSDYFRNELIELYSTEFCIDKSIVAEKLISIGAGASQTSAANKNFKIHNNKYCEILQDWTLRPVSNFWINIDNILKDSESKLEYECRIFIEDKSIQFFIKHKHFFNHIKLFDKLTSICLSNEAACPMWNSTKGVMSFAPQIIYSLSPGKSKVLKKDIYGIYKDSLTSRNWKLDRSGVILSENIVGDIPFDVRNPININNLNKYNEICKKQLNNFCSTQFGADVLICCLSFIYNAINNTRSHIVSNKNIISAMADVLGLPELDCLYEISMPQFSSKIYKTSDLKKHKYTISLMDENIKYTENFQVMETKSDPYILCTTEPMLLFIFNFLLICGDKNYLKQVEGLLDTREKIVNLRSARAKLNNAQKDLESFIYCISSDNRFLNSVIEVQDNTIILIQVFSDLELCGYNFKKKQIIRAMIDSGYPINYPVSVGNDRKIAISIKKPNDISKAINKNKLCKTTKTTKNFLKV
jgi:hypothetical protein